jgi:hypothetical protein
VLRTFSERPDLIVRRPGLYQELVGEVLGRVSAVDRLSATMIATAAVSGALDAVAKSPDLLDRPLTAYVADVAGRVSVLVAEKSIDKVQAADLLGASIDAFLENPELLGKLENRVVEIVLDGVGSAAGGDDKRLLAGATLVSTVGRVLESFARFGNARLAAPAGDLAQGLSEVMGAGLVRASSEIGSRIGLSQLPDALGLLAGAWLSGKVGVTDPADPAFKKLFGEVIDRLAA